MTAQRLALSMASLFLLYAFARPGVVADEPGPAARPAEPMRLTLTGTIRMPDGSPAPGATVESITEGEERPIVARTDAAGRFQVRDVFGNGVRLHARSADGNHQATRMIPSIAVRSAVASPIELTLAPVITHEVAVLADGRPVEGAEVAASGNAFHVHGVTGPNGTVRLQLPAQEPLEEVVAWHRELGVRGVRDLESRASPGPNAALAPPARSAPDPRRSTRKAIRSVSLELGVSVAAEDSDWAVASKIEAARVRTNADGTALVPWAPREKLRAVEPTPIGSDWKVDQTDLERIGDRIVTVHARRKVPVAGRLLMPAGDERRGSADHGVRLRPEEPRRYSARPRRADGSFTLRAASDHGYGLGVVDLEWAATPGRA